MSAPATEVLREMERDLIAAGEAGETRTLDEFLPYFESGDIGDVEAALDILRTHGKASEVTPGEWRAPYADEVAGDVARLPVPAAAVDEPDGDPEAARAAAQSEWFQGRSGRAVDDGEVHVRITRSIAGAIGDEALGALVRAGMQDAEGTFRLEIVA